MSNLYFKCPNCEKIKKIEHWTKYFANCVCTKDKQELDCNQVFLANENLDDLLKLLDKLGIQWGYDDIIWERTHPEYDYRAKAFDGNTFVSYSVWKNYPTEKWLLTMNTPSQRIKGKVHIEFDTSSQAKQACEEDFKKRKEEQ